MSEKPTIAQYEQNIQDENFKAFKCSNCNAVIAPPSGSCYACGGSEMEWTEVSGDGKLISFTVIHVAPDEFQNEVPYIIGIVELKEGTRITSRLGGYDPENPADIKIGIPLKLGYELGDTGRKYLCFSPK